MMTALSRRFAEPPSLQSTAIYFFRSHHGNRLTFPSPGPTSLCD